MDLNELQRRALGIHDLYDELNLRERGRVWTREEFMLGFVVIQVVKVISQVKA